MKNKILLCVLLFFSALSAKSKNVELYSPDKEIKLVFTLSDKIKYDLFSKDQLLLKDNSIQLMLESKVLGENPRLRKMKRRSVDEEIKPVVPFKYAVVQNHYNELELNFKDFSVIVRAFNDGFAYRFVTSEKDSVNVVGEKFEVNFPDDYLLHMQQPDSFKTAYEEPYTHLSSKKWTSDSRMATLPFLIDTRKSCKILISEADLADYPCMFLKGTDTNGIHGVFPAVPLAYGENGDRDLTILKTADYIACTKGSRNFPWRYFVVAQTDAQLVENTMTCRLSGSSEIKETSWIQPGQVAWEWWSGALPYGSDVNFVAGCNLDTYKYYIDFAAKHHIPYILMDEGWAKTTFDPYTPNPDVNLHELIRYGKEKNVGIILWLTWLATENNFDLFKTFSDWGVKGVKIDFMNRSDQWMVNFYERVAREAAKHHLLVDFHGAFKPAGLEYRYPNVLSYEGVRGMEQMEGCVPDNTLYLPFMRNAVGPMDYTPGAMISMQPELYAAMRPNAASIGTRAYQLALYVLCESGLQMLSDSPTQYARNTDCTRFITQVPVVWDETRVLEAKVGEYVVVAKRKGDRWFIGGITNNSEKVREFKVNLDFLNAGKTYRMKAFEDGINADRQAMDYRCVSADVTKGEELTLRLVRNGGFAAVIE